MARKRKRSTAQVRHIFWMTVKNEVTGDDFEVPHPVKVKYGTKRVLLTLEAHHVERSIELRGVGDLTKCSMAVCGHAHAKSFSHAVAKSGWLDWTYSRLFVASRDSKKTGLPIECYAYEHDDEIALLNDSKEGQQKLLAMIRKNGPIQIVLRPYRVRSDPNRSGAGRVKTGTRAPLKTYLKERRLRHAMATVGA